MNICFIEKSNLDKLLELLRQQGELHGPLRGEDGVTRFAPLTPDRQPDFAAIRTLLPPKKYLIHPRDKILTYRQGTGYQLPVGIVTPLILAGLHPCDLAGINYLDRLFLDNEPDPIYAARRAALTLIGISCQPDDFCSCHLHPSPLQASYDIFMQQIDNGFAISSGSRRGSELMDLMTLIIEERELVIPEDTRRFFGQQPAPTAPSEPDPNLPEWQYLAEHCLGCGACSICCPTCACFDVIESGGLDGKSSERLQRWDNCLLKSHSQVAGGMSFQKDRAERFRYRYRHKYRGFGQLKGVPGCVGCGRCRVACPAGLDLRPLAELLEGGVP